MSALDLLELIQTDCEAALKAEPYFADIGIVLQRTGITEEEIKTKVATLNTRGGKIGACILILMPAVIAPNGTEPGPTFDVMQSFTVLVHPEINRGSKGTNKDASIIGLNLLRLFHHRVLGYGSLFRTADQAMLPVDSFDGLVAYQINLVAGSGLADTAKTSFVTLAASSPSAPATVTLACGTPGASIYYTTDGSYPSSANPAAVAYTAPFAQASAALIRAAAEKSGFLQSNVNQLSIT